MVCLQLRQELRLQIFRTRRVQPARLIVFLNPLLQFQQVAIQFGAGQGRGEVVNNHRLGAAFGLSAFARVVDDERINQRQVACQQPGPAGVGEAERLARQPFQIAVLAELHDGVGAVLVAQPEIKGQIAVRGRQSRVMVGGGQIQVEAARGLDADEQPPEGQPADPQLLVCAEGVIFRLAPAAGHRLAADFRQAGEIFLVIGKRDALMDRL